ncbi:MAG TPA: Ig-like domain-containing protein [Pyrinomonadaceae bacterium]|jgi:hypothetical protein
MFPHLPDFPRPGARALTRLALALAFVLALQFRAEAAGTFVSAPNRVDMAYDSARDTLYITSGPSVLRYHLGTNSFLAPFNLGGNLAGLDLSPDGNTLVVADRTRDASNVWVHVVDLRTGEGRKATFPRDFGEGGTFSVAYGKDNRVLVTSTYEGSGWVPLRRLDPATGAWAALNNLLAADGGELSQDAMLAASGDRSVIGFAEANISDGRWGSYNVAGGTLAHRTWYENGTSWFNYEIGVNRNGTQYAIPTYGGTFVYNSGFAKVATLGQYAGPQPVGVVYHPVEDLVYFPWTTTNEVRAFNTNTFAQVAAYNFEDVFTGNGNRAFQQGRLKMSRDGSLLFCTVSGGVRFQRLYAPLAAAGQTVYTNEDEAAVFNVSGGVGNGGVVSYRVEKYPEHGTVGVAGATFVYTPAENYNGADSFTFRALYGPAESAPATVNVNVAPVNDTATAEDQTVSTDEDQATAVALTYSDVEGDAVGYRVIGFPGHGTLTGEAPNFVYTPAPDYSGADSIVFKVFDGGRYSNAATVNINVNPVNDAPAAAGQSVTTDEDAPRPVTLSGSDVEGGALSYVVVTPPSHGALTGTGADLTYTPAADYNGPDSFTFKVSDGAAESGEATVAVSVTPVNDAPAANQQGLLATEDTPARLTLSGVDVDGDALTYAVVAPPAHGTLSGEAPNLVYTPAPNYSGPDSFTFKANDGTVDSPAAAFSLVVGAVNDAPVANPQEVKTNEDAGWQFVLSGSDVDGDALGFVVVKAPAHGSLSGSAPNLVYTPAPDYNGPDAFSFKVNDGRADSDAAVVSVFVAAVNDAPAANGQALAAAEDSTVAVTLSASDVDGDALSYVVVGGPAHGTLSGAAPDLVYRPAPDYSGPDSFSFAATDGRAQSAAATVTVNVAPANDAPVAVGDSASTVKNVAVGVAVLANDRDVDGDALTVVSVSQSANGTVAVAPGGKSVTYTPRKTFVGNDTFTYAVSDGRGGVASATVFVTVRR